MSAAPPFSDLTVSTATVMVYTNLTFSLDAIYASIPIYPCEGVIAKKKIEAPYGSIVCVQNKDAVRGLDLRKSRSRKKTDRRRFTFFLNQITIELSLPREGKVGNSLLNIMMFRDNFKIVGCKGENSAVEAVMILWEDYLAPHPELWSLAEGETSPKFLFEVVMQNLGFSLGFPIDRESLNTVMNSRELSKRVAFSKYEPTINTNVNIKMYYTPTSPLRDVLVYPEPTCRTPHFILLPRESFREGKKKKTKPNFITFIVFSSSKIILSGRDPVAMREMYAFFTETLLARRGEIEEKFTVPTVPFTWE